MLGIYVPEIVDIGEAKALKKYQWELVAYKVWSIADLEEWLTDQGLDDYAAAQYAEHLVDYMLDQGLGYEYGGITPWCGEGYVLY
jgi:hypothetical protein